MSLHICDGVDHLHCGREASDADLVAEIGARVESGTIKGEEAWKCAEHGGDFQEREPDEYAMCMSMLYEDAWDALPPPEKCEPVRVLVISVPDGGSET